MASDRRQTTTIQKISLGIEAGMFVSVLGLVFAFGRNTERWDTVAQEQQKQGEQLDQLEAATAKVSGQVLQMATTSTMAEAEARIKVLEAKQITDERLLLELKQDMTGGLGRIEQKLETRGR